MGSLIAEWNQDMQYSLQIKDHTLEISETIT